MKQSLDWVDNERGSALLLVMLAVVFVGMLFGSLYVLSQASHEQALDHQLQVQAEFDAQKMMDIALYYYYQDDERKSFDELFATDSCYTDREDANDKVCLEVNEDGEEFLLATGQESKAEWERERTSTIKYVLNGTDDGSDQGAPYVGDTCGQNEFFLRALNLGSDLDLTRALSDQRREEITDEPNSVLIAGGLHLDNSGKIRLPGDPTGETLPIRVSLGGYLSPQGGVVWAGDADEAPPEYKLLGEYARRGNTCAPSVEWHHYLTDFAGEVSEEPQQVDVYKFVGNYTTKESTGGKKSPTDLNFINTPETLGEVLSDLEPKIVLIEGSLLFEDLEQDTHGLLIIYDPDPDAPANIYLPDQFVWKHHGAVVADRIARVQMLAERRKLSFEWPYDYRLSITLTREHATLYQQD